MELVEKCRILFMKANLKRMCFMVGEGILITKVSIGDYGIMDLEMEEENG